MMLIMVIGMFFSFTILASAWDANNPESVKEYVSYLAEKENLDVSTVMAIAKCESGFNKNALHSTEKEYSVGVFQINLKAHRDVTEEQALNPFFNINWAIDQMVLGHFSMWTCWRPVMS